MLSNDHGCYIIAENYLASSGVFGGNNIYGSMGIHICIACTRKFACHASAEQLGAVEAKDSVYYLREGDLAAKNFCALARFGKAVFGHCKVYVIIQMAVTCYEMTLCESQREIAVLIGD